MTDVLALLVPALAMALLHFLWQGALIGLVAWLALGLLRNARPQARYAVACLALLGCVLLPAANVALTLLEADAVPAFRLAAVSADIGGSAAAPGGALPTLPTPPLHMLPWVVALWAAGVALLSLRMACGLFWVRRLRREARADRDGRWQACVSRLAPKLGIAQRVALRLVEAGDGPVTAGWWKPVVLLPVAVVARMPVDLVEALIAHELAHVRRRDYLANLLQSVAEALLFYHPAVWWLSHRIRIERELVADELAAIALGEPRRLALALSELDRHLAGRSPAPHIHYAPAAHGGQLMSRIRQLVRPDRRSVGATIAFPLIGLAMAGAAFYAHARMVAPGEGFVRAAPAPVAAAQPVPSPTTAVPVAAAQALPAAAPGPDARIVAAADEDPRARSSYALVRQGRERMTMNGDMDDIDDIRAVQRSIDTDFLWFRRDGKAWLVDDADILARARQAWAGADALSKQMEGLDARMRPHNERMEALGERMEKLGEHDAFQSPEAHAATAAMERIGGKMEALASRQAALAERMRDGTQAEQLAQEHEALAREQEALQKEMERHAETLERIGARMEAQHAPMEALGREMEAASKPMEAIGKEMEVLGKRIEREANIADAEVRRLIDEAYRNGRARAAPVQQ